VKGDENEEIYSGKTREDIDMPEGSTIQTIKEEVTENPKLATLEDRIAAGKRLYATNSAAWHQIDGQGIVGAFPPLANSDYLNEDKTRAIKAVVNGLSGKITVNGKTYNSVMPAMQLSNDEVANV